MTDVVNSFARLNAINVSEFVEKKAGFAYLSWPYAVAQLRLADPTATWEVRRFDGMPFLLTEAGFFVEVAVTVQGVTLSQIHPVLDGRNRPLISPNAFDINSSIQRCLVKAIALHGLGLYVYAGEDLPQPQAAGLAEGETGAIPNDRPAANDAGDVQVPSIAPHPRRGYPTISRAQQAEVHKLAIAVGVPLEKVLQRFNAAELGLIRSVDYARVIRSLTAVKAA